jgi:hypothetical protein
MRQLHVARHAPEAYLVRGFLASRGIAAEIRGELLTSGWGELPLDVCSVWVRDDRDYVRAVELVKDFFSGAEARRHGGEAWTCATCGETLEGQFTHCWQCGVSRSNAER